MVNWFPRLSSKPALSTPLLPTEASANSAPEQRLFSEMARETKACKAKALREGEKYFYVFFLGTLEEGRGQGLCSAVVRYYQARATEEQAPIYLEAATEYCWRLYERLGFVTMAEMVLGEGKAAADGLACVGGPGVRLWSMIWRPEKLEG